MTMANIIDLITALTGLATAVAGIVSAKKAHTKINANEPKLTATIEAVEKMAESPAVADVAREVTEIINGHGTKG